MYEIAFVSLHQVDPIIVRHEPEEGDRVKVEYEVPSEIGAEALFVVKEGYSKEVAAFRASEIVGWSMRKYDPDDEDTE